MPSFIESPYIFESFQSNRAGNIFNEFADHSILKPWNVIEVNESDKYYGLCLMLAQKAIVPLNKRISECPVGFIMSIFNSLLTKPETPISIQKDFKRFAFVPELKAIYKEMESLGYVKILAKPSKKMNPDGQQAIYPTITKKIYIAMVKEYSEIKRSEYRKAKQLLSDL